MLLDILRYKEKLREWDIKVIYLVGPQGSGKTVIIRYIVYLLNHIREYVRGGLISIATNDIRILGDKRYAHYFQNKHVINLIRDDAIGSGTDSRMAMYGVNINTTQKFSGTRHTLEENYGPRGIIFMFFATQDYFRLDPTIRKNATLRIFTAYIDEGYFHDMFTEEQAELMRIKTYDGMVASHFKARRFAICRTMTGDVATLEIPFVSKKQIAYPVIDRSVDRDEIITTLAKMLLNHPKINLLFENHPEINSLSDLIRGELKGFLGLEAKEIEEKYCITLRKADFVSAIDRALILRRFEEIDSIEKGKPIICNINTLSVKDKIKRALEVRKIMHVSEICEFVGEDQGKVAPVLSQNKSLFKNIIKKKGFYCLTGYRPSQIEIEQIVGKLHKPMKQLEM